MSLEAIKEALGDKQSLIDEVTSIYETNTANVEKIGNLETDNQTVRGDIKAFKEMVREVTGLSELSKDNLSKFATGADEGLKADNETLQTKLSELQGNYEGLTSKHEQEITEMILKDTLRGIGIGNKVQNDRAFTELTKLVMDGAEREGATFTFKEDGKTIFNQSGAPLNVEGRIAQLQEGEYSYLFKQPQGGGANGTDKKPFGSGSQLKGEALAQAKADYIKTHGTLSGFAQPQ